MSTALIDNFEFGGRRFLDNRQEVATLADLRATDPNTVPDGFRAYCKATKKWYEYNSGNSSYIDSGKWREAEVSADTTAQPLIFDGFGEVGDVANTQNDTLFDRGSGVFHCNGIIRTPGDYNEEAPDGEVRASTTRLFQCGQTIYRYTGSQLVNIAIERNPGQRMVWKTPSLNARLLYTSQSPRDAHETHMPNT